MSAIARRGVCLVLAAPSGAGKTAIAEALLSSETGLRRSISVTTRPPRPDETEGVDYYFLEEPAFQRMAERGELLEWARVLGGRHCYGTPRQPVEQMLGSGLDMIFAIDWQGHRQLRAALPDDVVGVFILPPSLQALDSRLRARGGDRSAEIDRRMSLAASEISHWPEFDHVVVNDTLPDAVEQVRSILHAARLATSRRTGLTAFVEALTRT